MGWRRWRGRNRGNDAGARRRRATTRPTLRRPTLTALTALALVTASCAADASPEADDEATSASTPAASTIPATSTTSTTEPPSPVALRWLAVGDSYSSGEGLPDVEGGCGVSPSAYAPLLSDATGEGWAVERFVFSACSGAVTDDWPAHRDRWTDGRPNLITATYGGNDIGFTDVVLDCIGVDDGVDVVAELERTERLTQIDLGSVADTLLNRGCDLSEAEVQQRIDGLRSRLEALYGEMSDLVGPEGWVLILGYPSPVADPDAWDANRCDGVATDDGRLLRRAAQRLNGVISSSTDVRDNVRFVDVAPVFEGHGRCSGDDWIFGLADSIDDERTSIGNLPAVETMRPFHPNQAGHRAMAETLRRALDAELS